MLPFGISLINRDPDQGGTSDMLRRAFLIVVLALAVRHRHILTQGDLLLRATTWYRLVSEYDDMKAVYDSHAAEEFFIYGQPAASFEQVVTHPAFLELLAMRRVSGEGFSSVSFLPDGATLPTYLPVEEGAGAALGMLGLALADLWSLRGGPPQQVSVSQTGAALSTAGYLFLEVAPHAPTKYAGCRGFEGTIAQEGVVNPVRKAYRVGGDGSWIFLHGGFPKLKKGILRFLNVSEAVGGGSDKEAAVAAIGGAVANWTGSGVELEAAMQAAGLAATRCRTPKEWRETEQGKLVSELPPVLVSPGFSREASKPASEPASEPVSGDERDGASKVQSWRRLKHGAPRPLSDVLVLDFSHVIASPMVGRTLAEHGALVLKVVTQKRPRRALFDEETNNGKHVIELDLESSADRARLHALMGAADVLIDGYTEGVLGRHGFGEERVRSRYPDLIRVRVSCYGHVGPLRGAKGFQQNANFATGVATVDDEANLGYQLVSQVDYATGQSVVVSSRAGDGIADSGRIREHTRRTCRKHRACSHLHAHRFPSTRATPSGYLGALGAVLALTDRQQLAMKPERDAHAASAADPSADSIPSVGTEGSERSAEGSEGSTEGSEGSTEGSAPGMKRRGAVVRASLCQTATWMAKVSSPRDPSPRDPSLRIPAFGVRIVHPLVPSPLLRIPLGLVWSENAIEASVLL